MLQTGIGNARKPVLFGAGSRYGEDHNVSPGDYYTFFRFAREDVPKLVSALRIPPEFVLDAAKNWKIDGEEALLILLRRLAYPNRLVDLSWFFHRSVGAISTIVRVVLSHLERVASVKLDNFAFDFWSDSMPSFAAAVKAKRAPLDDCVGFVDGVFRAMCRPGRDGQYGDAQRAFYNGYKKAHGIEFQGVMLPNGMFAEMNGPYASRMNDKQIMDASGFAVRLAAWIRRSGTRIFIYGDCGYVLDGYIVVPFCNTGATANQRDFNRKMSKVRIGVEWGFGEVASLFAFCAYPEDLKLDKQPLGTYWRVATLLFNCHSCLYGNQGSKYFNVGTPNLEDYLSDI